MKKLDVIIIGAGAAGFMCAIEAGKRERSVLVLDHTNKAGKKILMSGGGRCNFTNLDVTSENFISHNSQFCKSALSRYTPWHFIEMVQKHKIPYHEKTLGQLFCDNKSKDILNMLLQECEQANATIQLNTEIQSIEKNDGFTLKTNRGNFACESLVIATGGLSIPTMGASPFGYKVAEKFALKVWPTRAGLVPFTLHTKDKENITELSGISIDCTASCNKQTFRENMLFTHRGLSGPAMLQISSYWQAGDTLEVDLLPEKNLMELLTTAQTEHPKVILKNFLSSHFSKRHIALWFDETLLNTHLKSLQKKQLESITHMIHNWKVKPNNTEGYRTAEVTLGGVDCDALSSKTFEVKNTPGLYFIGEVLDVTGWLGGYNFQWAWASGHAAGQFV